MRKTFGLIDDLLIERLFQPLSDFAAHRLGLSRLSASCCCLNASSVAWMASRTRGLSDAVAAGDAGSALFALAVLLLGLVALLSLRALFQRVGNKPANPLRSAMRPYRAIVLLLAAQALPLPGSDMTAAADLLMLLCATSALYLGACAERPPVPRTPSIRHTVLPLLA